MKQRRRRSYTFIYTTIIASSPFIEVDLSLTPKQMSMFIKGLKYIIPCQSHFLHQSIEQNINEQYQTLLTIVKNCLQYNCMSASVQRSQQTFPELKSIMHEVHVKKLPRKLGIRARREYAIVKSIQRLISKRSHVIVRRTDKSKVLYIGKMDDFLNKAKEYMAETNAYEEIPEDRSPLQNNLNSVRMLLELLLQKRVIDKKQRSKLLPKMNQLELAHLHFIPKPHKVNCICFPIDRFHYVFFLFVSLKLH